MKDNNEEKNKKNKLKSEIQPFETGYDGSLRKHELGEIKPIKDLDFLALNKAVNLASQFAYPFDLLIEHSQSYHNLLDYRSSMLAENLKLTSEVLHLAVPDTAVDSMTSALEMASGALQPSFNMKLINSGIVEALGGATRTLKLASLQSNIYDSLNSMRNSWTAVEDYVSSLNNTWDNSFNIPNLVARSFEAPDIAVLKFLPDYDRFDLPRGSKSVLKSLTKNAAAELMRTESVLFDPRDMRFYHKEKPDKKLSGDQITVAASSIELFADITLDELLSFESVLYNDVTFASEHPVGKKIFEIIKSWDSFIDFDDITYYHARQINRGKRPYLDSEMLRAPQNVSAHGRYNAVGKSCYYIAESKEGAVNEIMKHSGGKRPDVQIAGMKAIQSAKIIDLSEIVTGRNNFIEHLRFTVENDSGIIVKEYLLPNYVASCCRRLGIDGIKYKSTGYNCYVLWDDCYFKFEEGTREIKKGDNVF